jgi:hypothetical protein
MPEPIIKWYDDANSSTVSNWAIGITDSGTVSPDTTFLIWNNRGGATDVSDMTECTITTKDASGGDTGEIVTGEWIETRVDSAGETGFTPIGGQTTHPIESTLAAGTIGGVANSGTIAASDNYAEVTLHANVPQGAVSGETDFLLRVSYSYV